MQTAILTVFTPYSIGYLQEFLRSLHQQTDKEFTLLGTFDQCQEVELTGFKTDILASQSHLPPAKIRKNLLEHALKKNYESVIFLDSDDIPSSNRVFEDKRLLKKYPLTFCELLLFKKSLSVASRLIEPGLAAGEEIGFENLVEQNFLGCSHTALKTSLLTDILDKISDETRTFDWDLFSLILKRKSVKAVFNPECCTYYRRTEDNVALGEWNEKFIRHSLEIKAAHYQNLTPYISEFKGLGEEYGSFLKQVSSDPAEWANYLKKVMRHDIPAYPWWKIRI